MTDAEYLKAALKELGEDLPLAKYMEWVEARKKLDAIADGEEPEAPAEEEPAEAVDAPLTNEPEAKPVEAADKPSEDETPVAAADEPAETVEADVSPEEAPTELESDASPDAAISAVAAEAGMDPMELAAAMLADPAKFAAVLGGGMEGDPEADAALSDAKEVANSRIAALRKQVTDRDAEVTKLAKQVEELTVKERERRVHAAIEAGHVLDKDKDKLLKLARKSPELLDEWLGDAEEAPAVPTDRKVVPLRRESDLCEIDDSDPRIAKYVSAGLPLELAKDRVLNRDKRPDEAVRAYRNKSTGAA